MPVALLFDDRSSSDKKIVRELEYRILRKKIPCEKISVSFDGSPVAPVASTGTSVDWQNRLRDGSFDQVILVGVAGGRVLPILGSLADLDGKDPSHPVRVSYFTRSTKSPGEAERISLLVHGEPVMRPEQEIRKILRWAVKPDPAERFSSRLATHLEKVIDHWIRSKGDPDWFHWLKKMSIRLCISAGNRLDEAHVQPVTGNILESGWTSFGQFSETEFRLYDRKIYFVRYYGSKEEADRDAGDPARFLGTVGDVLSRDDLLQFIKLNYWKEPSLWLVWRDQQRDSIFRGLLRDRLLRILMVFDWDGQTKDPGMDIRIRQMGEFLPEMAAFITTGSVNRSFPYPCVDQARFRNGKLKNGDRVSLDLGKRQLNLTDGVNTVR